MAVDFTQGPATASGDTGGAAAPKETAYDVANTDLFRDLNRSIADRNEQFAATTDPDKLDRFDSIVLSDQLAPSATFRDRLRAWVRGGGNLILTDSAVRELPEFADVDATDVEKRDQYVGPDLVPQGAGGVERPRGRQRRHGDRPAGDLAVLGQARGRAVQQRPAPPDLRARAARLPDPVHEPRRGHGRRATAARRRRGTSSATSTRRRAGAPWRPRSRAATTDSGNLLDRTSMGELKYGDGKVRFLGALMPQPTQAFSHDFGIEPYSLTYTGHILLRNMLETPDRTVRSTGPGAPGFQAPSCAGRGGFTVGERHGPRARHADGLLAPGARARAGRRVPDVGRPARRPRAAGGALPQPRAVVLLGRPGEPPRAPRDRRLLLRPLHDAPAQRRARPAPGDAAAVERALRQAPVVLPARVVRPGRVLQARPARVRRAQPAAAGDLLPADAQRARERRGAARPAGRRALPHRHAARRAHVPAALRAAAGEAGATTGCA